MDDKKNTFITKDSGEHQQFETGARRDTQVGKGRYDLIPPQFLRNLALALEEVGLDPDVLLGLTLVPMGPFLRQAALYGRGAKKYGPSNYLKGIPLSRTFNSLTRHAMKWATGMDDEDHLTAVAWNAFAIVATEELIVSEKLPQTLADMGPKLVFKTVSENVGSMWSWIEKILNGDPGEKVTGG
jgi:hypothetical protein